MMSVVYIGLTIAMVFALLAEFRPVSNRAVRGKIQQHSWSMRLVLLSGLITIGVASWYVTVMFYRHIWQTTVLCAEGTYVMCGADNSDVALLTGTVGLYVMLVAVRYGIVVYKNS